MAMTRVKYGVEFDTRREEPGGSSGSGWIVVLVILVAAVSFVVHMVRRISAKAEADGEPGAEPALVVEALSSPAEEPVESAEPPPPAPEVVVNDLQSRPSKAKPLLLRLDEARNKGDIEMQVATIEQLRALPGGAVADIDDKLVNLLGALNMRRLFELKNPQWVSEVVVKRGDSAIRLAQESGSTFSSLKRLNPSVDFDRLKIGTRLKVMSHPDFALVIHKRLRSVELHLNGRLFKRYDLPAGAPAIPLEAGAYRTPANLREYFRKEGVRLAPDDAAELDQLVPRDTPVRVSES